MRLPCDSIVIISHCTTQGHGVIYCDSLGNPYIRPNVTIGDKVNPDVVVKSLKLDSMSLSFLICAFLPSGGYEAGSDCYNPHHSVLVYKDDHMFYVDLCFGCKGYELSINSIEMHLNYLNWRHLKDLFNALGMIRQDLIYDDFSDKFDCFNFR